MSTVTVPSLDASGHVGASFVLSPICKGLHAARPPAEEGETAIPAGSVTVASRSGGVAIAASSPDPA